MARRILVAIDNRDLDAALIEAAVRLAAERQAELVGLYVEESDFLNAAGLPVTRLYSVAGGWQALDPEEMRRAFRVRAEELRRELEIRARRRQISWELRTVQGSPGEQLLSVAADAELVILGRSRRGRHGPLGSTARRAVIECRAPVLLIDRDSEAPDRVVIVYAGDDSVLAPAEEMAWLFGVPLHAVVFAPEAERSREWRQYVEEWLEWRGWRSRAGAGGGARTGAGGEELVVEAADTESLRTRLLRERPGLLVLSASGDAAGIDLGVLLDAVRGPVLILRGSDPRK